MRNIMKIKYDAVKETVKQLENEVEEEIIKKSTKRYIELDELLQEMSGATCSALRTNIQLSQMKTATNAAALNKVLNFIRTSSQTIENRDKHLARQIHKK